MKWLLRHKYGGFAYRVTLLVGILLFVCDVNMMITVSIFVLGGAFAAISIFLEGQEKWRRHKKEGEL